ncbi:hypothetical protein PTSG_08889 [Salpingoeca rosetta]|uniref:PH domain-containing protein n=1 Tax=Salpingoeca rosetta (strain ATCC 50818 / BSB-021) TaxID=946362 RepID=F2UL00_SALR5|nr:uncharacterized protein PTSG_08889 [Salpingoeca rosetta]EGD77799.1 hypothetical protein PTSG_08889 [Salpingoeca rosetta]|eukprot:XP_004990275.1 hypothetical protein PTSG_08889 [Salpingoeca rosetta]
MSYLDAVIRAGFLDKSPPLNKAGSAFKGYKRRWFVLRSDSSSLNYYETSNTKKRPKGSINMTEVVKIEGYQTWPGSSKAKHPWVFTIETLKGRVYYLSASSEESMQSWVAKLQETFQFFLLTNNAEESMHATQALQNYSNGVIPVNVSLISTASITATVQVDESTTGRQLIALACRKTDARGDPDMFGLVRVDASGTTCERVFADDRPLDLLRRCPTHTIYVVSREDLPFALKLIKGNTAAPAAEEKGQSLVAVKFLGCRTITHDMDEEGVGEVTSGLSRQDLHAIADAMKKSPATGTDNLVLMVSQDGVKVMRKREDEAKRPYTVLLEHTYLQITDCFDMDKLFVYTVAINPTTTPKTLVYVFKCSDVKETTKLRFLFRSHCQAAHHMCMDRLADVEVAHAEVPTPDSLEFNSLWIAQSAARRRQSSFLRSEPAVHADRAVRVLLSAIGESPDASRPLDEIVRAHQSLLDTVLSRDEEA